MLVLLLAMAGLPTLAQAHDISIAKAELRERDGNRYELNVWTGPATAHLFQSPKLPDMCRFDGNPRGAQGTDRLGFAFTCNESLTANDRLHLPWKREGVMLTARWQDGSSVKRLFRREAGYIRVELSALQAGSGSWSYAAKRYLALGIDHLLFTIPVEILHLAQCGPFNFGIIFGYRQTAFLINGAFIGNTDNFRIDQENRVGFDRCWLFAFLQFLLTVSPRRHINRNDA